MHYRKLLSITLAGLASVLLPVAASAQGSSLNTFSPYSFYGIGDIYAPGNTTIRSMGGAGVAYRNANKINTLNPAAYSNIAQRSALFHVGVENQNFYLSSETAKSSFNTFNIKDLALQFPIAKGLGFAFSVTPYSSVGYRISTTEDSSSTPNIGYVSTAYNGSGGVNQFKGGLGYAITKHISIGAEAVYYHGYIQRNFSQTISPITGSGNYIDTYYYSNETVNRLFANFGVQANLIAREDTYLTLGATYQLGGHMKTSVYEHIPHISSSGVTGAVNDRQYISPFTLPDAISVGAFLYRPKWSLGADYVYNMCGKVNQADVTNNPRFRNTNTIKLGGEYTPNAGDVRHTLNRWTYRAGVRYSNYYMVLNDTEIDDMAITFGVGIPTSLTRKNNIDVGLEFGTRGTIKNGLIKENYFKVSVSVNLFGDDYWFTKYKFD